MSEPSHVLKRRKRDVRRAALRRRDGLSAAERASKSARILERVLALPELREARTVMAFWSFGSEVETAGLIERLHAAGRRVALPRVGDEGISAVGYAPGDPVAATTFGAMEPSGAELVRPEEVDAVIVPGVAFDRRGGRVGYGGGFYDRFLGHVRPDTPRIAVAFAVQVVDGVPVGGGDARVDLLVTEDEVVRPSADPAPAGPT